MSNLTIPMANPSLEQLGGFMGGKDRRKLCHNTYIERHPGEYRVLYHETYIVVYRDNGDIVLSNGGWFTPTTKDRIDTLTPARVWQDKGRWYVRYPYTSWDGDDPVYVFADGMVLHPDGTVSGAPSKEDTAKQDRINATKRKHIKAFIDKITPEDIVYHWKNTAGDCLLCRFDDTEHLLGHVEDNYFHATLAYNAIKAKGYSKPDVIMSMIYIDAMRGQVNRPLTDALSTYLKKHILEGVATR